MVMTVDEFVQTKVLAEYREIVAAIRSLMKECAPDAKEMISYGIPAYKGRLMLAVISPTKKGITLAFSRGADFEDTYGLLEGVGKVSKNVRMSRMENSTRPRCVTISNRRWNSTKRRVDNGLRQSWPEDSMIARIWHGRTAAEKADEYYEYLNEDRCP